MKIFFIFFILTPITIKIVLYYWDNGKHQYISCWVYSFFWIFSDWLYAFALGWGLVNWDIVYGFIFINKPCGNYMVNRMWFKNFTLHTWSRFAHCLLTGRLCWWCRLLTKDLTTILDACFGLTVDWRLCGLAAILSTSFVLPTVPWVLPV